MLIPHGDSEQFRGGHPDDSEQFRGGHPDDSEQFRGGHPEHLRRRTLPCTYLWPYPLPLVYSQRSRWVPTSLPGESGETVCSDSTSRCAAITHRGTCGGAGRGEVWVGGCSGMLSEIWWSGASWHQEHLGISWHSDTSRVLEWNGPAERHSDEVDWLMRTRLSCNWGCWGQAPVPGPISTSQKQFFSRSSASSLSCDNASVFYCFRSHPYPQSV